MQVNLHDAKTHLFRYVQQALAGEEIVIAKAGRPLVSLTPVEAQRRPRREGFLRGQAVVTAALKADFEADIAALVEP